MATERAQSLIVSTVVSKDSQARGIPAEQAVPIRAIVPEALNAISEAQAGGVRITGISTGLDAYDWVTRGLHDGELTVFASPDRLMATSLVLGMALHVASPKDYEVPSNLQESWEEPGRGVLIFSLGTSRAQIVHWMLLSEARVAVDGPPTGVQIGHDRERLMGVAGSFEALPIWVNDTSDLSCSDIRSIATRLEVACNRDDSGASSSPRVGLIVIDRVHRLRGGPGVLRSLKMLGSDLMVPIVATTVSHPVSDDRKGGRRPPQSWDRNLHDCADHVGFIDYDKPDQNAQAEVAKLTVFSRRNRSTNTVRIRWEPRFGRFEDLPEGVLDGDGT